MTRRASLTGISASPVAYGARGTSADPSIPFPPDPYEPSGRALLKRGYVTQALIDSAAVCFGFLFILSMTLSLPLAVFLFLFAKF